MGSVGCCSFSARFRRAGDLRLLTKKARLDGCYISTDIGNQIPRRKVKVHRSRHISDHYPISVCLDNKENKVRNSLIPNYLSCKNLFHSSKCHPRNAYCCKKRSRQRKKKNKGEHLWIAICCKKLKNPRTILMLISLIPCNSDKIFSRRTLIASSSKCFSKVGWPLKLTNLSKRYTNCLSNKSIPNMPCLFFSLSIWFGILCYDQSNIHLLLLVNHLVEGCLSGQLVFY